MEPTPFVANIASIAVISLAMFSFYLMLRRKGKYIDIVFGLILAVIIILSLISGLKQTNNGAILLLNISKYLGTLYSSVVRFGFISISF